MRLVRLAPLGFLLATLAAGSVDACGWYQTCETEEWLRGEIEELLP